MPLFSLRVALTIAWAFGLMGALRGIPSQSEHEVQLFLSSHFERTFFDLFDPRWYGGVSVTAHPPLLYQCVALLSRVPGVGVERAYALILATLPALLVLAANALAGRRAAMMMALNPLLYLLLVPLAQSPFIFATALALGAGAAARHAVRNGSRAWLLPAVLLFVAAGACHPLGAAIALCACGAALLAHAEAPLGMSSDAAIVAHVAARRASNRTRYWLVGAVLVASASTVALMWPFLLVYGRRALPKVVLHLVARDAPAWAAIATFAVVLPWLLWRRPEARVFAAFALVLVVLAATGKGPLFWDKLLFFAALLAILGLARDPPPTRVFAAAVGVALVASSAALFHRFEAQGRDQRVAIGEVTRYLQRPGLEKTRYMTLGFGKERLELGRRVDAPTIDGALPWIRTLPELDDTKALSLDELDLAIEADLLRRVLDRAEALSLATVVSADPRASPILSERGWRTISAFPGNVVLWAKDVPPIAEVPRSGARTWDVVWGVVPLSLLAGAFAFLLAEAYQKKRRNRETQERQDAPADGAGAAL